MKYDFTSIMDRRGKDAIAVDALGAPGFAPGAPKEGFDAIPMWVADMNFSTVPTIPEAIIARARHPAYGYFSPTEECFAPSSAGTGNAQQRHRPDKGVHRLCEAACWAALSAR